MRLTPASKQAMAKVILTVAAAVVFVATWRCLHESGTDAPAREREARADGGSAEAAPTEPGVQAGLGAAVSRPVAGEADAVSADRLIRGLVVDRGGIPLNHATIHVELTPPRNGRNYAAADAFETTVSVDAAARFAAVVPRNGRYRVAVRAQGFAPVARTAVKPGDDVEIALDVPCRVSGRVLDARTGEPIAGAPLRLSSWEAGVPFERGLTARSGADGAYSFEDSPSGDVLVTVVADRYTSSSTTTSLTLQPGEEKVQDLRLEKGLTISGRVLDGQTGRPIAGATFDGREGATGADGVFTLSGFETGERRLTAWAKGYLPGAMDVMLSTRRELDSVDFRLRRGATLSGTVVDPDGRPVPGATVMHMRERTTTAPDGGFEIALEVEAGLVESPWCGVWVDWPMHHRVFVEVNLGEVPRPFVIRLEPQDAMVSGTVRDGEGKPVAGARVELQGASFSRLLETDVRGRFGLEKLPRSASVWLGVLALGFDYADVRLEGQGPESATGIEIVLSPDGTRRREEERAAAARPADPEKPKSIGRVRGRVVDAATGLPLASQAGVGLYSSDQGGSRVESGTSNEGSGDFELEAPVGEAWIEAEADGFAASERRGLAVTERMTTDVGTIALVRAGAVEGIIRSAKGEAPGRRLGVVVGKPNGGPFRWAGWTDDTGWYELGGLAGGGEWLVFGAEDAPSSGSSSVLVLLSLIGSASVDSGRVVRLDGRMAAPASLVVEATTGPGAAKLEDWPSVTSECDPNRFDFDHLPDALAVSIRSKSGVPLVWVNRTRSSPWFAAVWRTESAKVELPLSHLAAGEYVVKVQRAGVAVERTVRLEAGEQKRVVVDLSR